MRTSTNGHWSRMVQKKAVAAVAILPQKSTSLMVSALAVIEGHDIETWLRTLHGWDVISGGLEEVIRGSAIAMHFNGICGCRFAEENGVIRKNGGQTFGIFD